MKGRCAVFPLPRHVLSILAVGVACLPLALADVGAAQQTSRYGPDRGEYDAELGNVPEYRATQARLANGWNTRDSRSVLRYVLLPEGMTVDLAVKQHREEPMPRPERHP
jgi:hypothetical protein